MRALLLALLVGVGGAAVVAAAATGNNKVAELSHNLASQRGYELLEDQTVSPVAPTADEPADDHHHHEVRRYPVASVEFARVETPFIIGLWIFCASLAKIGQCQKS